MAADDTTRTLWLYRVALLLSPALALLGHDNPLFAPPRNVDTWVYLGYFRHLVEFKRDLFPGLYYGSRLTWILPGAALHWLAPPLLAAVLLHLGVHLTAVGSLFAMLRATVGLRAAFLTALLFSASPALWYATGWDYVNGAGVALCLVAMALVTRAVHRPGARYTLVIGGAVTAALVYTNLFWLLLAPLIGLYCLELRAVRRGAAMWRGLPAELLWMTSGALALTLLFCAINYRLDGRVTFLASSLATAQALAGTKKPWFTSVWQGGSLAPWLWIHLLAFASSIAAVARWKRASPVPRMFATIFLLAGSIMALLQFHGDPALGLSIYSSYLLPFSFPVLGAVLWRGLDRVPRRQWLGVCTLAALSMAALWFDYRGRVFPLWPAGARLCLVVAAALLVVSAVLRRREIAAVMAVCGLAALASVSRALPKTFFDSAFSGGGPVSAHQHRELYQRVIAAEQRIEPLRAHGPIRFWYDRQDPAFFDYTAINSLYLYEYTLLSQQLPADACAKPLTPGMLLVVGSSGAGGDVNRALAACPNQATLRAVPLDQARFDRTAVPYTLSFLRIERDPAALEPLRAVLEATGRTLLEPATAESALPLDAWVAWNAKDPPRMHRVAEGLAVRTPPGRYAFAVKFPALTAPTAGRYLFTMAYRDSSGRFAFGGRRPDGDWYAVDAGGYATPAGREMSVAVDLKAGEAIVLAVENNADVDGAPASLTMTRVTAARVTMSKP